MAPGLAVWPQRPHSVAMPSTASQAASRGALIVRAPELGTIAVTGRDRQSWLNGLVTSDLSQLGPGVASYGLVLVKVGRIVADAWMVSAGGRVLLGGPLGGVGLVRDPPGRDWRMEDRSRVEAPGGVGAVFAHGALAPEPAR